jgi:hypothetical protein
MCRSAPVTASRTVKAPPPLWPDRHVKSPRAVPSAASAGRCCCHANGVGAWIESSSRLESSAADTCMVLIFFSHCAWP